MILYFIFVVIITLFYSWLLWKLDRYEHEPMKLLVAAFLWGAIPAILLSGILEVIFSVPIKGWVISAGMRELALGSFLAPVVEESVKGLALLGLYLWAYWEFDDPVDGIVYGGLVGFGFAMVEDFAYISGSSHPLFVTMLRTIPFGLNHAFFTGITGAALGFARLKKGKTWRYLLPIAGLLLAMTFHAVHNLGATASSVTLLGLLLSVFSDWMGVLWLLIVALIALKQERGWIKKYLSDEVGECISESDFEHIISRKKFKQWLKQGSPEERKLRKELYDLTVNLAFKKAELAKNINKKEDSALDKQIETLRKKISTVQNKLAQTAEEEA